MAEVRALQDVGQFSASIEELREILAVQPDLPEANYRLGLGLMQTGEPSQAVWALQKSSESPEYAIPAGMLLTSAHYSTQNYDEAIRAADRVLGIDPDRATALRLRAKANLGIKRFEEALDDAERLVELSPDDYATRVLHATILMDLGRTEEAEKAHFLVKEMGAKSEDKDFEIRACLAPALFAKDHLKDMKKAERLYEDCASMRPTEAAVVDHLAKFFDQIEETDRATALIRTAVDEAPESLSLRSTLANRLRSKDEPEAAEQVLLDAVESFGTAASWNLLAAFYRSGRDFEKALGAIDKVVELSGGGSDQVRFTQADILIDTGDLERAEQVAATLEEPIYARLIRGRILLDQGDAAGALASFEQGIRNWPNNAGARYLAGLAALELGDFDRAISELREAVRVSNTETEASLVLARLHHDRGEHQQALNFANLFLRRPQGTQRDAAYRIAARSYTAVENYERARRVVELLSELPGQELAATIESALVERAASGPQAAVDELMDSGLDLADPANGEALRLLVENLVLLGKTDRAVSRVESALATRPESVPLHELRGTLLARSGNSTGARRAFETAIGLDGEYAPALAGLATLTANAGDLTGAVLLFDRAAAVAPDNVSEYAYAAAQLTLASGQNAAAERRLREVVRRFPGQASARNDLAWLLAESGRDLDGALSFAEDARRLDPSAAVLDTLGWVHLKRGEPAAAVVALEKAVEADPSSASIRYHLGVALSQAGEAARAREMLETSLHMGGGAFPDADAARRELALLDRP
jgi:tetratricopeptide (TPR) repeat protein